MRAAAHPARGLHTLPVLANGTLVYGVLFGFVLLGMHFDDPLSWLAAMVYGPAAPCLLGAFSFGVSLRPLYSWLFVHHRAMEQQALDFAERFAAALSPPPPSLPAHSEHFHSAELVYTACRRAAAGEALRLRRGLSVLATISVSAPLVGFLGTVIGILNSFPGGSGSSAYFLGLVAERLAHAIVPTAWALAITCLGFVVHAFLSAKWQALEQEMETLSLSLTNALDLRER